MRFGARRRPGGKHAGERSRRRRSAEAAPQDVAAAYPVPAVSAPQPMSQPVEYAAPTSYPQVELPPPTLTPAAPQALPPVEEQPRLTRAERRAAREAGAEAARHAHAVALESVPLAPPSAGNGLLAVFQRRYLLKLLVKREISARYQGSFFGLLWSYIGPACQFFVYWFVLGQILGLHKTVPNFGIHIFCGLVVVHFFTETFGAGTRSIVRNKSIVVKLPLPREMFPVASMLVSLFHVFPQLVILTGACLAYGWRPDVTGMAALALAFFVAMTLGTAGALLFSAANVFFRDFSKIVELMHMFVRFSVPMIYPFSLVDERFGSASHYYLFNPLADCVLLVQRAFWVGSTSDPEHYLRTDLPPDLMTWGLAMAGASLVLLAIGQLVFSRLETRIPERL